MDTGNTDMETMIGYSFTDGTLLTRALTHRSFSNENDGAPHNERLEFLGDAVLGFITAAELYGAYPDEPEGTLSLYRTMLVRKEFLFRVAGALSLHDHIRVSGGQKKEITHAGMPILADAVEAIIGALYLDGGLPAAERFIRTFVLADMEAYLAETPMRDAKTALQEIIQRDTRRTPEYVLLGETGPDHRKTFTVGVKIGGAVVAEASGPSKQDAEQKAAEKMIATYDGGKKDKRGN